MKPKPQDWDKLKFGHVFSDHMLTINWTESGGWEKPIIRPLENLSLHPAAKVLHYGIEASFKIFKKSANSHTHGKGWV